MMKRFIKEEYSNLILQLAQQYVTDRTDMKDSKTYADMEKTLETMDIYVAYINNMGFMMYKDSIKTMVQYIEQVNNDMASQFPKNKLEEIKDYLSGLL